MTKDKSVLISGASMAGLSAAHWMHSLGYKVTVVEMAGEPRTAGGAVNIEGTAVDAAKRMGIYDQLIANRLNVERIEFKDKLDLTAGSIILNDGEMAPSDDDIEIERDKFIHILFDRLRHQVDFSFNNSITALTETKDEIFVSFKDGSEQAFDLVLGCDGTHSAVRRIWFGSEDSYTHFLRGYFSITIVNRLLVPQKTMQMYNVPDKAILLNAYNNKTDIIYIFNSEKEISYDYRDEAQQRKIIEQAFEGSGWRNEELMNELQNSPDFYFDKFCQIKMPSWSKGRVALIGDAAYCASPAAGKGASLAVIGATALADALIKYDGKYAEAFEEYENLRPFINEVQAKAEQNVRELVPRTEESIRERNAGGMFL